MGESHRRAKCVGIAVGRHAYKLEELKEVEGDKGVEAGEMT